MGRYADDRAFATVMVVGRMSTGLRAERPPGTSESADHLIVDQDDSVLVQYVLDPQEVTLGRNDDTACSLHGLGDERRDRFRALALDQRLQGSRHSGREVGLAFPLEGLPVVVGDSRYAETRAAAGRSGCETAAGP